MSGPIKSSNVSITSGFKTWEEIAFDCAVRQEQFLMRTRDRIISLNRDYRTDQDFIFQQWKMFGILSVLGSLGIDTDQFNWVYK